MGFTQTQFVWIIGDEPPFNTYFSWFYCTVNFNSPKLPRASRVTMIISNGIQSGTLNFQRNMIGWIWCIYCQLQLFEILPCLPFLFNIGHVDSCDPTDGYPMRCDVLRVWSARWIMSIVCPHSQSCCSHSTTPHPTASTTSSDLVCVCVSEFELGRSFAPTQPAFYRDCTFTQTGCRQLGADGWRPSHARSSTQIRIVIRSQPSTLSRPFALLHQFFSLVSLRSG